MVDRRSSWRRRDSDGHKIGKRAGGEKRAFDVGLRGKDGLNADAVNQGIISLAADLGGSWRDA